MSANAHLPFAPAAPETEPAARRDTAPLWPFILLGVMLYAGGLYVDARGGGFNAEVYEPYHSLEDVVALQPKTAGGEMAAKGKKVFQTYCQVCHQANGLGTPGQFPPLAGSEWVLAEQPTRIIRAVLNGFQGPLEVKGQQFGAAAMPPWKDMLKDDDLAAVLTYIRDNQEWGNKASPVTPEQVKAIREKIKDRTEPFTPQELLGLPLGQ